MLASRNNGAKDRDRQHRGQGHCEQALEGEREYAGPREIVSRGDAAEKATTVATSKPARAGRSLVTEDEAVTCAGSKASITNPCCFSFDTRKTWKVSTE